MAIMPPKENRILSPERLTIIKNSQKTGIAVRITLSLFFGLLVLAAYQLDMLRPFNFYGLIATIAYLLFINVIMQLAVLRIRRENTYYRVNLFLNLLEIAGFTAAIYFCGGIEASFLTLLYCIMIVFKGISAPRRYVYITACLCVLGYSIMIVSCYTGLVPDPSLYLKIKLPLIHQIVISFAIFAMLFTAAVLSNTLSGYIKGQRDLFHRKSRLLVEENEKLKQEIYEQRRTEKAIRKSEQRYQNILSSIEDGYYETDLNGNLTYFNDATCRILGYDRDTFKGRNFRTHLDESNYETLSNAFNKVYRTGIGKSELELTYRGKDGMWRIVVISISLIKDDQGNALGFRGLIRNTTERTKARAEREKLKERLQRSEKLEAVGALAGGVAHDLNNILLGLTSYPELLLSRIDPDSQLVKPLMTIQKSGEKAVAVVQDLLSLSHRGVKENESVNLNAVLSKYLDSPEYLRLLEFHPNITTETRPDPRLANVIGSTGQLAKLLSNLVSNAAEAMNDGGRLKIFTQNITLDRTMKGYETIPPGDYAMISVEDTGEGISERDIERIFEPFYTKRKMGRSGTGLGMAVVWSTVKDHEGYIDIKSRRYVGTTISIYLPMTSVSTEDAKKQITAIVYEGNKESILVVDDIAEQREIATEILEKLNYHVVSVESGEAAIEYVKDHPVDLLLLDMIMAPGIDGLDTYKEIIKMYPEQKAIIASGFTETERVKEALRLGVGQYVKKPYSIEKIGTLVRQELDK